MFNYNSGYKGYSMSNRAAAAYEDGERPYSKWTKAELLIECKKLLEDLEVDYTIEDLKKLSLKALRNSVLVSSSWHHTSKYFNSTDFYKVSEGQLEFILDKATIERLCEEKKEKKEEPKEIKARCKFLVWSGTRNHPKATECEEVGTIRGNWFYREDGSKKSVNANGFRIVEEL